MNDSPSIRRELGLLLPLVPAREKRVFLLLLALSTVMALNELAITGLVALLAAAFSSPAAVLQLPQVQWLMRHWESAVWTDTRLLVLAILVAIVAAVACKNVLNLLQQWGLSSFGEGTANALRRRLLKLCLQAPYLWVLRKGTSELLFAMKASIMLNETLASVVFIFSNTLMVITIMAVLIAASPLTSLIFVGVMGVGGVAVIRRFRKSIDTRSATAFRAQHHLHSLEQKSVHGLREMRLYGREKWLLQAYGEGLDRMLEAKKKQQLFMKAPITALEVLGFSTLLMVLLFLIFLQDAGMARISGIMGFLAAASWRCLPVANRLVDNTTSLRANLPFLHSIMRVLGEEKDVADRMLPLDEAGAPPLTFRHGVRFEGVCFRYEDADRDALNNVSFTLEPGRMLGLIGLSGSGKSTLVNALTGIVTPTRGRILVDGVELGRHNIRSWLDKIGYVSQSPYLLDATLAENVALSRYGEEIDRRRVEDCCRMAAIDFVDDLADGIDSMLGERGVRLSGGQAQRVAIARALYSRPELIIFDEATSSLDIRNERAILDTILSLRDNVTMIVIAHRLSTVESCDSVIWMENGAIRLAGGTGEVLPRYLVRLEQAECETNSRN